MEVASSSLVVRSIHPRLCRGFFLCFEAVQHPQQPETVVGGAFSIQEPIEPPGNFPRALKNRAKYIKIHGDIVSFIKLTVTEVYIE